MIYRRYASLYFLIGIDIDEDVNELSLLEFIHNMVETLDKYFENVCELDVSTKVFCEGESVLFVKENFKKFYRCLRRYF